MLNPDRTKISKRAGAVYIGEFREMGYLPEALNNFLALLGWNPGTDQEIFSMDELVEAFSVDTLSKSDAVFDIKKLDWFNGVYIRSLTVPAWHPGFVLSWRPQGTELAILTISSGQSLSSPTE